METGHKRFSEYIFYLLVPLIIVTSVISYYRFMVNHEYLVGYEGVCDPVTEKCFIGCENDACTKEYYYSEVQKYAPDLSMECGKDITDCEVSSVCLPDDRKCSVTYCDIEVDGDTCETLTEEPEVQSDNQVNPAKEELLQSNGASNTHI